MTPLDSFRTINRIAVGGFGIVDEGVGPNDKPVAIKKELASDKVTRPILEHEYHVYKALAGHDCIVDVKAYGRQSSHIILVMDLLGPSLGDRFRHSANQFSLRTTIRLALGMLDAIEHIHSRGFIHRDVKPENFLLGRGEKSHVVHPVDFGLVRPWRHIVPGTRVSSTTTDQESGVIGTLPFASLNAHLGLEQTRRDDLQALVYCVLLFARGHLPWDHIKGGTRMHCARRILEKKRGWGPKRLCQGLPKELEEFSTHCFDLDVNDDPDYNLLRGKLDSLSNRKGWDGNSKFEWEEPGWTASELPELAPQSITLPQPRLKRGDIVLMKLLPEKSLDYEPPPRVLDTSFFPHQTPPGIESKHLYRPALIRKVVVDEHDPTYFKLEVFPLTRRTNLTGLSKRRSSCSRPLETCLETKNGIYLKFEDVYVYQTALLSAFKVEYYQTSSFTTALSVPNSVLDKMESELSTVPTPYSLVYDSDDAETQSVRQRLPRIWCSNSYIMDVQPCEAEDFSGHTRAGTEFGGVNAWISEMIAVEQVRKIEDGGKEGDDSDSDSEDDGEFWDSPRPVDRRLSCTIHPIGRPSLES